MKDPRPHLGVDDAIMGEAYEPFLVPARDELQASIVPPRLVDGQKCGAMDMDLLVGGLGFRV